METTLKKPTNGKEWLENRNATLDGRRGKNVFPTPHQKEDRSPRAKITGYRTADAARKHLAATEKRRLGHGA